MIYLKCQTSILLDEYHRQTKLCWKVNFSSYATFESIWFIYGGIIYSTTMLYSYCLHLFYLLLVQILFAYHANLDECK